MPSILSHPAVPLAIGIGLGPDTISKRLLWAGVFVSILPDLDVLAFRFGIAYSSHIGHRGFSHSILCAFLIGLMGAFAAPWFKARFRTVFLYIFESMASHGILDSFTNGGLGIAFLWPWKDERYFAPFRVIEVAPIGLSRFLSPRGLAVLYSEFLWVWLPCLGVGAILFMIRKKCSCITKRV